jgi:broad-specificity NMP kinase
MLTGSPGAGKSLCANHLLSKLKHLVIKLNANIVHTIPEVQSFIADKLLRQQPEKPTAVQILRQL